MALLLERISVTEIEMNRERVGEAGMEKDDRRTSGKEREPKVPIRIVWTIIIKAN